MVPVQTTLSSQRSTWTTDDVRTKIEKSKVVVFAKGDDDCPRCGFSERVIKAIKESGRPYEVINVYEDRSVIPALKAYSGEHHLPLVYVDGELVSNSDTQSRMLDSGELNAILDAAFKQ